MTNELKIMVKWTEGGAVKSAYFPSSISKMILPEISVILRVYVVYEIHLHLPKNIIPKVMTSWYTACPKIFLAIVREIKAFVRPYGFLNNSSGVGISVAKAKEASVSMIRFTHSIWTACNT